ncbi:nuclear RNA export factor 1 isoform X2 [Bombyx mori]|uniref:Nuclear RNA export factor 1 n=1 Tax=Bombyx mori TaxID=7091 RepID=A0A8R2R1C2_BOMMO|nr:nuclear RNA export factor 1 isoform X2 [Bombyx mori]
MKKRKANSNLIRVTNNIVPIKPKSVPAPAGNKMPIWEPRQPNAEKTHMQAQTSAISNPNIMQMNNIPFSTSLTAPAENNMPVWELQQPNITGVQESPFRLQLNPTPQTTPMLPNFQHPPHEQMQYRPQLPIHIHNDLRSFVPPTLGVQPSPNFESILQQQQLPIIQTIPPTQAMFTQPLPSTSAMQLPQLIPSAQLMQPAQPVLSVPLAPLMPSPHPMPAPLPVPPPQPQAPFPPRQQTSAESHVIASHQNPSARDACVEPPNYAALDTLQETEDSRQSTSRDPPGASLNKRAAPHKRSAAEKQKKQKLTTHLRSENTQRPQQVGKPTTSSEFTPVHLREDVRASTEPVVMRYLMSWPWKNEVRIKASATVRHSKSQMIAEQELMEQQYSDPAQFFQVSVRGHGAARPEPVLDALLASVRGRSLIPCFVQLTEDECKFLVIRCKTALLAIHKYGFVLGGDGARMTVTVSAVDITTATLDFLPKVVLKKILTSRYKDGQLDLSAFTAGPDIKHFIYYPLNRVSNQTEIFQIESTFIWENLTHLNLSRNRITSLVGLNLAQMTPRLRHLDVSHNALGRLGALLAGRALPLRALLLEGNPLCADCTDPDRYVQLVQMIFPTLVTLDGIHIKRKGEIPKSVRKTYCPDDAKEIVHEFVQVYFPLLDSALEQRAHVAQLYHRHALVDISYNPALRSRRGAAGVCVRARRGGGRAALLRRLARWPRLHHDRLSFTVDVLYHSDEATIFRVGGVVKLTSDCLADEEEMIYFSRTLVLKAEGTTEYKIHNEMLYWDEVTDQTAKAAFQVPTTPLNLNMDSPEDEIKQKIVEIFMSITKLQSQPSEKCLELNNWNLKTALEYFINLLKDNNSDDIM